MDTELNPADLLARLDDAAHRATTPIPGGRMVWRRWGAGPALVLVHGASGSWRHWARNIDRLATGHTLWVPDLPGMGDSDVPEGSAGRPALARMLLDGLGELLGEQSCDLVGFSFGGSAAGIAAGLAAGTGRIRSLVLVGSAGFGPSSNPSMVGISGLLGDARREAHRQNLHSLMIADPARIDALAIEIQDRNTRQFRANTRLDRGVVFLPGALGGFDGPLHAAWGTLDQFTIGLLDERAAQLRAARPDVDFHLFEGAGHWVAYEAAAAFDAWLLGCLSAG